MLWSLDNLSEIFDNLSELLCIRRKMRNFAHKFKFIQNSMAKKCFIYLLFGVVCLGSCSRPKAVYVKTPQTDSIAKVVTGLLVKEEYERAQEVVDSANAAGWLDPFDAQMLRLRIMSRDEAQVSQTQAGYEALLNQDLTLEQQAEVLHMLTTLARGRRNDQLTLEYGTRLIDVSRKLGLNIQAMTTQSQIGSIFIRIGRVDVGMELIEKAINELDETRRFSEMDACVLVMKSKIRTLIDLKRHAEVIPVGLHMIAKLQDYAYHPEDYADGSRRLPSDANRPGYVDFYTGQAYAFITYAYAAMDSMDQARRYSRLFDATRYSRSYGGRKQMASAWCMLGEYDRMSAIYDEMQAAMGADTVNYDYGVMLYNRATAAQALNQPAQCADFWRRYAKLQQHINDAERLVAEEESAVRYHMQEHQYALEREHSLRRRNLTIAVTLGVMLMLLVAFTVLVIFQLRATSRKNAVLTKEIKDNIDYKDRYLRIKNRPELFVQQKDSESLNRIELMSDAELFEFLRVVIVGEQLYLNPVFDRQQLMERFHLTKERVGAAFSQGSQYVSLAAYINECRLSHGAALLSISPELSISEIATESGFANASVFTRNFKQRYTITPSEFRQKAEKNLA